MFRTPPARALGPAPSAAARRRAVRRGSIKACQREALRLAPILTAPITERLTYYDTSGRLVVTDFIRTDHGEWEPDPHGHLLHYSGPPSAQTLQRYRRQRTAATLHRGEASGEAEGKTQTKSKGT